MPKVDALRATGAPEPLHPQLPERLGNSERVEVTRHAATNTPVVRVVDRESGQVLVQVPPEQVLDLVNQLLARTQRKEV